MEFWASAEVNQPAYTALTRVRRNVEAFLNTAFAASSLAVLQCELRYVPILMPERMHARYPARSKLRKRERIYDCAPILDYDVFVEGSFEDQLQEYLRGIALSAPHLAGLGASPQQIEEFRAILATALERIIAGQPGGRQRPP
jgi:hypothetical protein